MGLYDDDTKAVTSGDLNDQDYWWSKFDLMMLDLALKQRQPEGRIGLELASTLRRLDALVTKYPAHTGLKSWLAKATNVSGMIDPNASRGASFNPGCPWDEPNFGQLWVNLHHAQMQYDAGQNHEAASLLQNVRQNLSILLRPDRLKNYPPELRQWVEQAQPAAEALQAKIAAKQ
jgi:hypothetical protein